MAFIRSPVQARAEIVAGSTRSRRQRPEFESTDTDWTRTKVTKRYSYLVQNEHGDVADKTWNVCHPVSSWKIPDIEWWILPGMAAICEWCNDACYAKVSLSASEAREHINWLWTNSILSVWHHKEWEWQKTNALLSRFVVRFTWDIMRCILHPSHNFEKQWENHIGWRTETAQHHHCCFRFKFHTRGCLTQKGTCHARKAATNRCFNTDSSR